MAIPARPAVLVVEEPPWLCGLIAEALLEDAVAAGRALASAAPPADFQAVLTVREGEPRFVDSNVVHAFLLERVARRRL